mgnify:CR=1 FL=1
MKADISGAGPDVQRAIHMLLERQSKWNGAQTVLGSYAADTDTTYTRADRQLDVDVADLLARLTSELIIANQARNNNKSRAEIFATELGYAKSLVAEAYVVHGRGIDDPVQELLSETVARIRRTLTANPKR